MLGFQTIAHIELYFSLSSAKNWLEHGKAACSMQVKRMIHVGAEDLLHAVDLVSEYRGLLFWAEALRVGEAHLASL